MTLAASTELERAGSRSCDHAKADGDLSADGTWFEEWCLGCGADLDGQPVERCSDCGRRVPDSWVDLCCRTTRTSVTGRVAPSSSRLASSAA